MMSHGSDMTQIKPRRSIIRVSCVRGDGGKYTEHFIHGGSQRIFIYLKGELEWA